MSRGARLVLTSGRPSDTGGEGPRRDFIEIGNVLGAQVLHPGSGRGALGILEARTRRVGFWGLALEARRAQPELVVSLAEKVGLAVDVLNRSRVPHVVVAHHLTSPRRQAFQRLTGWLHHVDRVVVLARAQARYLLDVVGLPAERVRFQYDKVDHRFFAPQGGPKEGYVLSVGRNRRDYATLIEAVVPLGVPVFIVPSSSWMVAGELDRALPPQVRVLRDLSYQELRQLYDRASAVVVPLQPGTDFAAGVNSVLEAMAMAAPLVVSDVPGINDYVTEGETARLVAPGDPDALRGSIAELLADADQSRRLGLAGRAVIEGGRNLDGYVTAIAAIAAEVAGPPPS